MTKLYRCGFPRLLLLLLSAGSLLLAGCSTWQRNYEEPEVRLTRIVPLAGAGLEQRFLIGLRILNPNRDAINVAGMSYSVSLRGQKVVSGVSSQLPRIPGYGEAEVELEASTNLLAGARVLLDLMNRPAEPIDYELEARLDVGRFALPVRIRDSGSISLGAGAQSTSR